MRKLVKALIPHKLFKRVEPYGHLVETMLANLRYGFPARNLKVIGVTGTDGKTTTTTMIWNLLKDSGYNVGYMTTIGYGSPKRQIPNSVHMTTMQAFPLMRRIKELKADGVEWLVLEVTSHALAQNRVWGVPFQIAVMTNIGHEHLDYHGTFDRYLAAKCKLFRLAGDNSRGMQVGVVNADDPAAPQFSGEVPKPVRYGINYGEVQATKIKSSGGGTSYQVKRGDDTLKLKVNIPGRFNVYNSLAAVSVGFTLGLSNEQIERGISSLKQVEGRMTYIDEGQDFSVVVDFAHTPDSFEKLLGDMRQATKDGRLIVMFGSAGRRDEAKRAKQGAIAGKYADVVVVTEEDDRDADGLAIMQQIAEGAETSGKVRDKDLFCIHNRIEAINYTVGMARKGDTVMLLGKGHEKTIERADGEHLWDEVGEAKTAIQASLES